MANSVPFRTTPPLGPPLTAIETQFYWDPPAITEPSPKLGTKEVGNDGHDYVLVKASGNISSATQVTITEPAFTVAAGSGGYYTGATGVTTNQIFWARKGASGAP